MYLKHCLTGLFFIFLFFTVIVRLVVPPAQNQDMLTDGMRGSAPYEPNEDVSLVNIYYSDLGYAEYIERITTFSMWLSNFGGQMGLFLGASFITLTEVVFTLLYLAKVLVIRTYRAVRERCQRLGQAAEVGDAPE